MYPHRKEEKQETNFLEVDASLAAKKPDIYNMVATADQSTVVPSTTAAVVNNKHPNSRAPPASATQCNSKTDDDFIDDPDVPPLI